MSNTIMVKGNAGTNLTVRYTANGKAMGEFSLGDNYGFGDKKSTQWWKVVIWGDAAHDFERRITKGIACEVTGRAEVRTFEKKDGTKGWSAQIHSETIKLGDEVKWEKKNPDHWQDRDNGISV